jgi:hypothetical protein
MKYTLKNFMDDVEEILDYLWQEEEDGWIESGRPEIHIYHVLSRVNEFIDVLRKLV